MVAEEAIAVFLSEFDFQVESIKQIYGRLEEKAARAQKEPVTEELVDSIGYWLHNLYSAYEDLFKQVASFWENSLQDNGAYHMQLLKRMRLSIPGVRPPLLSSEECVACLDELRAFRHVFRHAYSYGLDNERVFFVVKRALHKKTKLLEDMSRFRDAVEPMGVPS